MQKNTSAKNIIWDVHLYKTYISVFYQKRELLFDSTRDLSVYQQRGFQTHLEQNEADFYCCKNQVFIDLCSKTTKFTMFCLAGIS